VTLTEKEKELIIAIAESEYHGDTTDAGIQEPTWVEEQRGDTTCIGCDGSGYITTEGR
jgi:hypothetical protein